MNFLIFPAIGAWALLEGLSDLFLEICIWMASKVSIEMVIQLIALSLVHMITG